MVTNLDNSGCNHLSDMIFLMNDSSKQSECLKVIPLPRSVIANLWQMSWDEIAFLTISNSVRTEIDQLLINDIIRNCPKVKLPGPFAFEGDEIVIDTDFLRRVGVYDFCCEFAVRLISALLSVEAADYKMLFKASEFSNVTDADRVLNLFPGRAILLFSSISDLQANSKIKITAPRCSAVRVNGSSNQLENLTDQLSRDRNFLLNEKVIVGGRHNLIWALPQIACMFYLMKWILQSSEQIDSLSICLPHDASYLNFAAETAVKMGLPARIIHYEKAASSRIDKQPGVANVIIKTGFAPAVTVVANVGSRHLSPTYAALIKSIQSI